MLSTDAAGDTVVRFSYNLLTTSDYDPTLGADVDHSSAAARRGRPQAGASCQRPVPRAAHQCADPGRLRC